MRPGGCCPRSDLTREAVRLVQTKSLPINVLRRQGCDTQDPKVLVIAVPTPPWSPSLRHSPSRT